MAWPESSSRGETEVKSVWMGLRSHELCSSSAALQLNLINFFFFHFSCVFGERDE